MHSLKGLPLCCLLLNLIGIAYSANDSGSGGVVIRLTDDKVTARCVDASRDRISLTLRRLVTTKYQGWFTKDTQVAVKIDAKVTPDIQPDKPLSFPLMSIASFGNVPSGQVSLPIEYPVISNLALTQDKIMYISAGVQVTLINLKDPSQLGSAIQILSQITSSNKLPIPASPYLAGATYLLQFANDAINKEIQKQKDANNASISGALTLSFDPNGVCEAGSDFETSGTKAIVYSQGVSVDPGYIDIKNTNAFCFSAELTPTFILKAARKSSKQCGDPSYAPLMKNVTNDYIAFFLNKFASKKGGVSSMSDRDYEESLARCTANGITNTKICVGNNPE